MFLFSLMSVVNNRKKLWIKKTLVRTNGKDKYEDRTPKDKDFKNGPQEQGLTSLATNFDKIQLSYNS